MTEIKKKTDKDLIKTLNEKRESLRAFRFGISGSKTRNVKEGRNTRKEVARILTELKSRG
ncbi:MAG: 50S ribosomal protein L29 [Candidatus Pacebacteria bacterium]|nr:50S ribosomal protein L29 [Candidatus Paceibacterota bacterium]